MKQLQKTDFIRGLLRGAVGEDVDVEALAVFEVAATSTVPLRGKGGTIFDRAVIAPLTINQLAALTNRDAAPLMMDHNLSGSPFGKFFYAEAKNNDLGYLELRGMFYVDPTETQTIAKLDNATIDEVSVAFPPTSINCSQCGFDYKAAADKGDIVPMLMQECPDGHKVAEGAHVILNGATEIIELSLVSRGAAKNSKIIGQSNAILGKDFERLAASGLDINNFVVTASAEKGIDDMDLNTLVIQLSDTKAELAVKNNDLERLTREHAEAVGARNESETRIRELETQLQEAQSAAAAAPSAEEREEAEDNKKAKATAEDFLKKQYVAVLTAAGKDATDVPDNIAELVAGIEEHRAELSAILPIDGVSEAAGHDKKNTGAANLDAFKVKR